LQIQDEPLSPGGLQVAQRLVAHFSDQSIKAIYISAYQRTAQTSAALAEYLHITPVVDARLNEINNGLIGNMAEAEFRQVYPAPWQAYHSRNSDFRFPGGETGAEAQARLQSFFAEKLPQHQDNNILLVCHDGLIRLMLCTLLGLPVYRRDDFHVDFCGLTELRYQEEYRQWQLVRFNQACGEQI
jgi:broad specificity phosphatase PhoE